MLKKSDVPVPPRRKEQVVPVPELGGEVLVRGLLLSDRLDVAMAKGFSRMAVMLAACVLVDGGTDEKNERIGFVPLYSPDEWERWGAEHYEPAMKLWDKANTLSDNDGAAAEKNSAAQKSESPAA